MLGASSAPFWFSAFFLALMPTSIGYQDLAALLAQQPGVSQRWRDHLIASPFGTIDLDLPPAHAQVLWEYLVRAADSMRNTED